MADPRAPVVIQSPANESFVAKVKSHVFSGGEQGEAEQREALSLAQMRAWEKQGGRVLDLAKLHKSGVKGYLVYTPDGSVWTYEPGREQDGRKPSRDACGIVDGPGFGLRWYSKALDDKGHPLVLDDLVEMDKRREQAATAQRRKRDRELARRRKTAVPVTVAILEGGGVLTLRTAGERIRNAGGTLEVRDGRLVVGLPPDALGAYSEGVKRAARRLYLAEPEVVRCLKAKTELPDRQVLRPGRWLPNEQRGHARA